MSGDLRVIVRMKPHGWTGLELIPMTRNRQRLGRLPIVCDNDEANGNNRGVGKIQISDAHEMDRRVEQAIQRAMRSNTLPSMVSGPSITSGSDTLAFRGKKSCRRRQDTWKSSGDGRKEFEIFVCMDESHSEVFTTLPWSRNRVCS